MEAVCCSLLQSRLPARTQNHCGRRTGTLNSAESKRSDEDGVFARTHSKASCRIARLALPGTHCARIPAVMGTIFVFRRKSSGVDFRRLQRQFDSSVI